MPKNKKYTTIALTFELRDKLNFMASKQGKSQTQFLTEVIDALFDASSMFTKNQVMLIDSHIAQTIFTFGGKSNLVVGSFPVKKNMTDKQVENEIHREASKRLFQEQEPEEDVEQEILVLKSKKKGEE